MVIYAGKVFWFGEGIYDQGQFCGWALFGEKNKPLQEW